MHDATSGPAPAAAVAAVGLVKRFGSTVAVDRVDLTVPRGEFFGLLGPNGAGKTTIIRILTTLLPPSEGAGFVEGHDVVRDSRRVRSLIGYVPQVLSADGNLTGYENLLLFAKLHDVPRREREERIQETLQLMGLTEHARRLTKTYSGGMIRRLEIAQALVHDPRVLFLDEPTVGLDPVARSAVWDALRRLRADYGATIVLTTHYMEEADELCDRVGIMHRGRIAALGSPDELKAAHGTPGATLEEVFAKTTGGSLASDAGFQETKRLRRTVGRMG